MRFTGMARCAMKKSISGKVREVFDLEDGRMVIVTTDRISAFDVILPTMIPGSGFYRGKKPFAL